MGISAAGRTMYMVDANDTAVILKSLGCRTNQEEIATLGFELHAWGFRFVENLDEADIVIVNTCSVTAASEAKTRRVLNQISRKAPRAKLMVTGCLAQQKPHELAKARGVHWVVGNSFKGDIPRILANDTGGVYHGPLEDCPLPLMLNIPKDGALSFARRTRYPVKIQEGCDFRCAYCIVPFLRGFSRSAPVEQILDNARAAVDNGFQEIVLTGTHIGQYKDPGNSSLGIVRLLEKLISIPGSFRVRLSSLDPRDVSRGLLDIVGNERRVCEHLHVSVQSLSTSVLKKMNRPSEKMESFLEGLHGFIVDHPSVNLGGDFIVGFPGESDEMFEHTLHAVSQIGFSYGHVFRYSKRPGTASAAFRDTVEERTKTSRGDRLRALLNERKQNFVRTQVGRCHQIIVEDINPIAGLTSNYLRVEVPSGDVQRNCVLDVVITGYNAETNKCTGAVADDTGQAADARTSQVGGPR